MWPIWTKHKGRPHQKRAVFTVLYFGLERVNIKFLILMSSCTYNEVVTFHFCTHCSHIRKKKNTNLLHCYVLWMTLFMTFDNVQTIIFIAKVIMCHVIKYFTVLYLCYFTLCVFCVTVYHFVCINLSYLSYTKPLSFSSF